MRVLVDADGCPVVDIAIRRARAHGCECVLLCDTAHEFNREGARTVTVDKGADSVDFRLANMVEPGDVVVTQDYGLAAMCLARRAVPLHQDGFAYTEGNIDALLAARHKAQSVRRAGGRLRGPHKRRPEQDGEFEKALDSLLGGTE